MDDTARPRITIGVMAAAEPDRARDPSIHVAAEQVYQTLVRVDCMDRVVAGLAERWSSGDRLRWEFDIMPGTRFSDGTPANARTVAAALAALPVFAGVAVAGEYELRITLRAAADVRLFASPVLAVRRTSRTGWPAGTGPYEPSFDAGRRVLQLIARPDLDESAAVSAGYDIAPDTIAVRAFGADLRAAIDAGVDAVLAHDAATIEYARARSGYSMAPLTWSRTYVLATAANADSLAAAPAAALPDAVIGAAARPALPPYWWEECSAAEQTGRAAAAGRDSLDDRILFLRDDPVARSVAERVTALAHGRAPDWLAARLPSGARPSAIGVSAPELLDAIHARAALAVVVALPRVNHGGCGIPSAELSAPLLRGWDVMPLVDTRDHLVYRAGIGRVTVDADGSVRFGGS